MTSRLEKWRNRLLSFLRTGPGNTEYVLIYYTCTRNKFRTCINIYSLLTSLYDIDVILIYMRISICYLVTWPGHVRYHCTPSRIIICSHRHLPLVVILVQVASLQIETSCCSCSALTVRLGLQLLHISGEERERAGDWARLTTFSLAFTFPGACVRACVIII